MDYNKIILDIIKEEVANYYQIPLEYLDMSIKGNNKKKNVVEARRMAIYLSFELTSIDKLFMANSFGIYDDDRMSARAFIVHCWADFNERDYELEINKLKPICEKKINDKIEEIRKSVDIVDVIRKYITLEKRGKNYFGICPFHEDTLPSLSVSQEKQTYRCFSCGASGNAITFVKDYEQVKLNEKYKKYFGSD